jgi:predicted nucleic acid-binding protein
MHATGPQRQVQTVGLELAGIRGDIEWQVADHYRQRFTTGAAQPVDRKHWQSALSAQRELARRGQHRAVGVADLLTATLAAAHHLTVVHYDADFRRPQQYWRSSINGSCHAGVSRPVIGNCAQVNIHADCPQTN